MAEAKLITCKSNIAYLSNFTGSSGFMLLTKRKSYLFTDSRYIERAKNRIKRGIEVIDITKVWRNPEELEQNWQKLLKKHRITKIGIEESDLTIAKFKKFKKISGRGRGLKFFDISGEIEKKREIKNSTEIELIKKSHRINERIFNEIKKKIIPGSVSEIDFVWQIKELAYKYGADGVSFDPIVAFGKNSAIPHHLPDETVLKKRDVILIDMGVKYKGYCSDMTRTILPKNPTAEQKKVFNIVLSAQREAIEKIKEGITGAEADNYSRSIICDAGYGDNYGHSGGHGIGLDIHEIPSLSQNYEEKLRAGSVITVEPGIYLPGRFGVRIEDMILVKKNGNVNLTKTNK